MQIYLFQSSKDLAFEVEIRLQMYRKFINFNFSFDLFGTR
jgi:hypothetical protein